jgi:GT2 family glycosyltransferase
MRVSIVVPTYRRADLLDRCLAALARQQFAPDEFEIIVADDAASDSTRQQVQVHTGVRYVAVEGRHGPAAARNAGWRAAQGEIIAFTDDDCIPDSNWLAAGMRPFTDPDVVAVTGQTIVPLGEQPTDFERNTAGLETSEFITANCFCRRAVLERLGGFDEAFTLAWREDSDLHFRLLDTGGRIVREAAAIVVHPVRKAAWGVSLHEQRKSLFDALLFRKHPVRFRERIRPACPWDYYALAGSAIVAAVAAALGAAVVFCTATAIWACLTLRLIFRRLRSTTWSPLHLAEMVVTSLFIPFLSIYWRLYGALRFRALFW